MKRSTLLLNTLTVLMLFLIVLAGCSQGQAETPADEVPPSTSDPTATTPSSDNAYPGPQAISGAGVLEGVICYPSEAVPALSLRIVEQSSGTITSILHPAGQSGFKMELPAGTYTAYAFVLDNPGTAGLYSQAVSCGLNADCTDHSLIEFTISAGQVNDEVQICDWYAPPEDLPPYP